jgi:hypothetical protein
MGEGSLSPYFQEINMILTNPDEAMDVKPTLCLEDRQLKLLRIDVSTASVGQSVQLCSMATITSISQHKNGDGIPCDCIRFELSNIELEEPESDPMTMMYPNSPVPAQ